MSLSPTHSRRVRQEHGLLRGGLANLSPFLFLGVMLPPGELTPGEIKELPRGCFHLGLTPRRKWDLLGFLLPLKLCTDPWIQNWLHVGGEFMHPGFTVNTDRIGQGWTHLDCRENSIDSLRAHCQVAWAVEHSRGGPVSLEESSTPSWASWSALEAMLAGLLPWPLRSKARLEAVLVSDPAAFQKSARPRFFPRAHTVHQLPPPPGASLANPASVEVRFSQYGLGWMELRLEGQGQVHSLHLSQAFDPMEDLAQWLGRSMKGELPALLFIDEEGHDAYLALRPHGDPALAWLQIFGAFMEPPEFQVVVQRQDFATGFSSTFLTFLKGPFRIKQWYMGARYGHDLAEWEGPGPAATRKERARNYLRWIRTRFQCLNLRSNVVRR